MPRLKKLTDYTYSPTNPASEDAIRAQIDDAIQEVYDDSPRANATVNLTGDQTIADIKTFSSSPIVPTPTTALQASTKKYVDDTVAGVVLGQIPDGSLTDAKLSDTAGQIKDRVATNTSDIATNASDISTNATNIATNATNLDILRLAKTDTGVADAYIVDTTGTFSRVDGNTLSFIPNNTNTGASTINEDSNGVAPIEYYDVGTASHLPLEAEMIKKFNLVILTWNASRSAFQLAPKSGGGLDLNNPYYKYSVTGGADQQLRKSVSGQGWLITVGSPSANLELMNIYIDGSKINITADGPSISPIARYETGFDLRTLDTTWFCVWLEDSGDGKFENGILKTDSYSTAVASTLRVSVTGEGVLNSINISTGNGVYATRIIADGADPTDGTNGHRMNNAVILKRFKTSLAIYTDATAIAAYWSQK